MTLGALLRWWNTRRSGGGRSVSHGLEPVPHWVFERSRFRGPSGSPATQPALKAPAIAPHIATREEEFAFSRSEIAELVLDVGPHTSVDVTAEDRDTCLLRLRTQAGGASEHEAREALDRIRLVRDGKRFALPWPYYVKVAKCRSDLTVLAPPDLAVTICATYAGAEVYGIEAPVGIWATHGSVRILDTTGNVRASAQEGGIHFSGERGQVRLDGDQISLRITATRFHGALEASARGAVRLLLPAGFVSPLEAVVKNDASFVCRADIRSKISRREGHGGVVFSYGYGEPAIRLLSLTEGVLIYNSENKDA